MRHYVYKSELIEIWPDTEIPDGCEEVFTRDAVGSALLAFAASIARGLSMEEAREAALRDLEGGERSISNRREVVKVEFGPTGEPLSMRLASDDGKTHWEGCEMAHGHSECARRAIEDLRRDLVEARAAHVKAFAQMCDAKDNEMEALRAELARVNASFQRETARNSGLTHLLAAWMQQHELEHEPGPWSKGCSFCALVLKSRELLKDTIFAGALEKELRAARQPEQPQSEDDKALTALVDEFAAEMKLKLLAKRREGNWGWDNPENRDKIEHGLFAHLKRPGQWIDVANYAAFLWNIDRQPEQGDPI